MILLFEQICFQVVGPMADNPQALFGDYASDLNKKYTKSPFVGLQQIGTLFHTHLLPFFLAIFLK